MVNCYANNYVKIKKAEHLFLLHKQFNEERASEGASLILQKFRNSS